VLGYQKLFLFSGCAPKSSPGGSPPLHILLISF